MTTPTIDIPTHCPQCRGNRIVYKAKASLWECLNCEDRFAGSAPRAEPRRLDDTALYIGTWDDLKGQITRDIDDSQLAIAFIGDLRAWYQLHLGTRPELIALSLAEQSRVEELLIERSDGMILYLKMIEEGFREGSITVSMLEGIEFGPPGLYRRYFDSFQTRFGSDYEHAIKPLLRLLLSAGGPLPKDLACEVLDGNSEQFLASRNRLGSYVLETSAGFELFHKTLAEWLRDQSSWSFHLDVRLGRQLLADVLFKEVADRESHLVRWRKQIQDWLPGWLPALAQREDAVSISNLGTAFLDWADYINAHSLFKAALEICEKVLGPAHPATASTLNNLASLLKATGDYAGAEPLYRRALEIREMVLGPEHPDTVSSLNELASLLSRKPSINDHTNNG